jgi:uncharacterized protein (DUF1501 family)
MAVPASEAIHLDGFFGLHPRLADLEWPYREGVLAIIPACGSEDDTRSHFEAQDLMEHGGADVAGGWLGRWLRQRPPAPPGGLDGRSGAVSAVAFGTALPESLRGAPNATVLRSLSDLGIGDDSGSFREQLRHLYAGDALLADSARDALEALERLAGLRENDYRPQNDAAYSNDDFALALRRLAQLIKADVGLEAACLDLPGWDTHFLQGTAMEPLMKLLGSGLAAFARDLGKRLATTTVVVMTEFGRRLRENSSLGTDHGRGSVMLVLGGGVQGGIAGRWPGLDDSVLVGPGDLSVAHNYRDVITPVIARHGGAFAPEKVFPGYHPDPLPL